jgi:hypothetical protein
LKNYRGGFAEARLASTGRKGSAGRANSGGKPTPRQSRLARLRAALARLERMANDDIDARKKDTREKIELGGLIVKAGLRYEKRALLLGR